MMFINSKTNIITHCIQMKTRYITFLSLLLLTIFSGCSKDFDDMNVPTDAATEVEPKFFLNAMQQGVIENYQRNVNLYPDLYSQYWSNTAGGFESGRYEYVDVWIGNQWREHYTTMLRRANAIEETYGENENYTNIVAVKDIWMCYWWSRMSDSYGDIPYFDASEAEAVKYTSQAEIYSDLLRTLDEAVNNITPQKQGQYEFDSEYDLIFKGDMEKWQKFGNSLRLRLAMRISNVDRAAAANEVQKAISGPAGLLSSNDDVAKVPLWKNGFYDYLHNPAWNWGDIRMSKTFSDYCYNQSRVGEDPRTSIWFTYKDGDEAITKEEKEVERYEGLPNGLNLPPTDAKESYATMNLKGGYVDFTEEGPTSLYCPVMFYAEVEFLLAEAALRGWHGGNAKEHYEAGIRASMEYVGVDNAEAEAYIDGLLDFNSFTSKEAQLKQLITQKWLANFPNGVEAWADFRRTDYPDITLPTDGVSGSSTVAPKTWVKRINYPDNEHRMNSNNMPEGMNTTDTDRMDKRVWWDVADTKTKSGGLMNSNF